jgi:hypothetical protein
MFNFSRIIGAVVLMVSGLVSIGSVMGQRSNQRDAVLNIERLRQDFIAATGSQLTLVDDKIARSPVVWGAFRHWLAFVKPTSPGTYTVKYSVTFPAGDYSRGERSYEFRVFEQGCRRSAQPYINAGNYCLGDTVILPIRLDGYQNHTFTVNMTPNEAPAREEIAPEWLEKPNMAQPPPESVRNPVAEHLKYLGMARYENLLRSLRVTISYAAIFEAVKPGRFNFSVGPPAHPQGGPVREPDGQAVIVVDRDAPVTSLAPRERTLDYSRYYVSTVGNTNTYPIGTMILQVGDTIAIGYWPGDKATRATPDGAGTETVPPPVIHRHVFKPPVDNYDAWIRDYLPDGTAGGR